jgi:hypothetical protein
MSEPKSIGTPEEKLPTKVCCICRCEKPASDFHPHKTTPDRLRTECKSCGAEARRKWRASRPKTPRAPLLSPQDKWVRYRNKNWALSTDVRRGSKKKRRPITTPEQRKKKAQYCRDNRDKQRAHKKVYRAVKRGILIRPDKCERCGLGGRIEGSHSDYSKALEVEWLCVSCHKMKDNAAGKDRKVTD